MLPKLIVFDLDGVLVDVSCSYLETVRRTVRSFLKQAQGGNTLPDPIFPLDDLTRLKQTGGLNNDWDLTAQALSLLFALVDFPQESNHDLAPFSYEQTIRRLDVSSLADFLKSSPEPLMRLFAEHGKRKDGFVSTCFQGEVGTGNIIKQIFQEIYLGDSLFFTLYGFHPRFLKGPGLINEEKLLAEKGFLKELAGENILAIATGRPKAEADYTLNHFKIRKCFRLLITLDDCQKEEARIFEKQGRRLSLSKPHPYMLDLIARKLHQQYLKCYYLGDLPDDMQAASASEAGFYAVGVTLAVSDKGGLRKELLKGGARSVLDNFSALKEITG